MYSFIFLNSFSSLDVKPQSDTLSSTKYDSTIFLRLGIVYDNIITNLLPSSRSVGITRIGNSPKLSSKELFLSNAVAAKEKSHRDIYNTS